MTIRPVLLTCLLFTPVTARAQEFEVTSVKRSLATNGGAIYHMPGGRFKAEGLTLLDLISFAYDVPNDRIEGLPAWGTKDRFDVEATGDGPEELNPARMETPVKKAKMKQLLADRFALRVQTSQRTVPTYALVQVAKRNKLVLTTGKPYLIHAGKRSYTFQKATMAALAKALSTGVRNDVGRTVIDKTGLDGEYDFTLTWSALAAPSDDLPSIFDALQQQLGLQLKPDQSPLTFLTVNSVQSPTAN